MASPLACPPTASLPIRPHRCPPRDTDNDALPQRQHTDEQPHQANGAQCALRAFVARGVACGRCGECRSWAGGGVLARQRTGRARAAREAAARGRHGAVRERVHAALRPAGRGAGPPRVDQQRDQPGAQPAHQHVARRDAGEDGGDLALEREIKGVRLAQKMRALGQCIPVRIQL